MMAGAPTMQTRVLYALGDEACVLLGDLADLLQEPRVRVGQAAALLIERGLVDRIERGCYQLTAAGRHAVAQNATIENGVTGPTRAPRQPPRLSIRQRAWNVMRIQRRFTVNDIVTVVGTHNDGDITENLRRYCCELGQAGYLRRDARRQPGTAPGSNGYAVWRLVRDTGEVAPIYSRKHRAIHDFNTGEDAACARA